jgi:beta-lactamase regulating signal transducer with metallopeptidase domain
MSAQWMLYALVVGVALTLAALAGEQSARLRRRPARGMWALAMVLTVALPLLVPPSQTRQPVAPDRRAAAQLSAPARVAAVAAIGAGNWLPARSSPTGTIDIDQVVRPGWQVSSALALLALAGASLALQRRARHWQRGTLAGKEVLVSVDAGPAVLGVLRPHIVVPAWLLRAPAARQVLVIAHEQAHIDAGDQRLLAAMALLLVAMPWNVPLWFQLRRLRLAIEVDCDARVLDQGHRVADYGAALIDIGSHASSSLASALAPAMAESTGFLVQRVRLMTRRPARWHRFAAPVLLLMAIETGVAAARIPAPPQGAGTPVAVAVPQATREALAGY